MRRPLSLRRHRHHAATAVVCLAAMLAWTATASAQLDPLLFVKRVPPNVIIVVDTSLQMLQDGNGNFYDPMTFAGANDAAVATALGLPGGATNYRRIYRNLLYESTQDANTKFEVEDIIAVPNTAASYATFWDPTRLQIAKRGIEAAVSENASSQYRWALLKLRQNNPAWRVATTCDKPARVTGNAVLQAVGDTNPCFGGGVGKYAVYPPAIGSASYAMEGAYGTGGAEIVAPGPNNATTVLTHVRAPIGDATGRLIPAGVGTRTSGDRSIAHALDDARAAAIKAMQLDTVAERACRNTVVVLITAGKDEGNAAYLASHNAVGVAGTFAAVSNGGVTKRVPIHVVAIKPTANDEAPLQSIASASGGRYRNVSSAAEVAAAINYAMQSGFARFPDFQASRSSEFLPVSPIVGTVNLKGARDKNGVSLPNTEIRINDEATGQILPQRSNMLVTAGFALPGFAGRIRAARTFKPVLDPTKPAGWKFVNDGTGLWPDLDGRPEVKGMARTPADPADRNIYTYVPGSGVIAFSAANAATLATHLGSAVDASGLIDFVRAQPLGAVIGSTPALMDPPSLDPPPDDDYGRAEATESFAGRLKSRRSIIFVGANDGMIHAIDARTGYEVWAFIPYNLLPKLRTLIDGQPVDQFDYFVDSSPKIAEVKIDGEWRSLLIIGQGQGGTFYQAFDVTSAGLGVDPTADDLTAVNGLLAEFDAPDESIQYKWSFPRYSSFNPAYTGTLTVTDGTPGGKVKFFGDIALSASYAEKTVGFTWSDPAVGPIDRDRNTNAVIVGSGYFPDLETLLPGRGASAPKAGNVLYLINADTGELVGNPTQAACSGSGCISVGDVSSNARKNALQADPTAASSAGSHVVNKAYLGDIDGKYWRFNFTETGGLTTSEMTNTSQPIYASSALLFVGSQDVYMFFSTGSDLLPTTPVSAGGTGTFKLYGLKDNTPSPGATVMFTQNLAAVSNVNGLATGERPSTAPSVAGDIVFYTATTESAVAPCSDFTSTLYAVTYVGGAAYDSTGDGKVDRRDTGVARTMTGRATAPFIVDQHLYVATTGGGSSNGGAAVEAFGDPEDYNNGVGQVGVRILSWREIR